MPYNQQPEHNPDIWGFHCSALVSAVMRSLISLLHLSFFPPSSLCKGVWLITRIISGCDKLQRVSSQEARLEVLLKEDSLLLSLNELFLLY